ncbi:MAG TPA: SDR family oxidoreductase [Sphingomicrobium sp.]
MAHLASPVLIMGARSDIARALAHRYAAEGCAVILAARNSSRLEADRANLALRHGGDVTVVEFDVLSDAPDQFFAELADTPGTVVMVAGLLGDQAVSARDDDSAELVMNTNFNGPARFLLAAARAMAGRTDSPCIIGISSVAGDRGRGSNFVYGSAKAGLSAFLSGMRNSLATSGIHVMTVKPGFVATEMTRGMKLPPLITASPSAVADAVVRAHRARRDVIYTKPIWRLIMTIIKLIPERLFKRLSL